MDYDLERHLNAESKELDKFNFVVAEYRLQNGNVDLRALYKKMGEFEHSLNLLNGSAVELHLQFKEIVNQEKYDEDGSPGGHRRTF